MKTLTMISVFLILVASAMAQPPLAFKYQTVVRSTSGEILVNQQVSFRITIKEGSTAIYREIHSTITNQFGLAVLDVGAGTPVLGSFSSIDWRNVDKSMEVELDPAGGSNYLSMGTSDLQSVPYALFSGSSADAVWIKNNTDIYYNDGNVGIGTSTPDASLHVNDRLRVGEDPSYPSVYGEIFHEGTGNGFRINANAGGGGWADMHFMTNGTTRMFLESAGKLGIGTESPSTRLVVKSSGYTDGMYVLADDDDPLFRIRQNSNVSGGLYLYDSAANSNICLCGDGSSYINSGNVAIGNTSPLGRLSVEAPSGALFSTSPTKTLVIKDGIYNSGNELEFQDYDGTVKLVIADGGYLGVGTASPESPLHVNGTTLIGTTSKGIRMRNTGTMVDVESLGTDLALNYQTGENTVMNVVSGNVGIGTASPTSKLDVRGNVIIRNAGTGAIAVELGTGLDYAEGFNLTEAEEVLPGTVLCIDPEHPGELRISRQAYDHTVAGIVAGANSLGSGVTLGTGSHDVNVALAGRVFCNVDATVEAIEAGDLLTTSSLPGYAMKASDREQAGGAILGKSMENLEKGKTGRILVLVTLQ
ncbi:MAG: hypothetical protein JW861_10075 [Bacteroidales bacterium]|nr:hypothetical protein [Bacteroidales bacterium]